MFPSFLGSMWAYGRQMWYVSSISFIFEGGISWFDVFLQILGKAEFLNPGGSVKDRVAVKIIEEVIYYCVATLDFARLNSYCLEAWELYLYMVLMQHILTLIDGCYGSNLSVRQFKWNLMEELINKIQYEDRENLLVLRTCH